MLEDARRWRQTPWHRVGHGGSDGGQWPQDRRCAGWAVHASRCLDHDHAAAGRQERCRTGLCPQGRCAVRCRALCSASSDITRAGADEGDILAAQHNAIFRAAATMQATSSSSVQVGTRYCAATSPAAVFWMRQDQLTLEWAGAYRHYHAAQMRTMVIGDPTDQHRATTKRPARRFWPAKAASGPATPQAMCLKPMQRSWMGTACPNTGSMPADTALGAVYHALLDGLADVL
jgi:hypothetical protein